MLTVWLARAQSNVIFSTDGCLLHRASEEAAEQAARAEAAQAAAAAAAAEQERAEVCNCRFIPVGCVHTIR